MPWVVGIDEAGYGPNLGPLVQAAAAFRLPPDDLEGWEAVRPAVRRSHERDKDRLLVDDSKKVYSRGGLPALERVVLAARPDAAALGDLVAGATLPGCAEWLTAEGWYDPREALPVSIPREEWGEVVGAARARLAAASDRAAVADVIVHLVPAAPFNAICDEAGSKGAVLARGLVALLQAAAARLPADGAEVHFYCDKQGGRNFYASMIQAAFPEGWVVATRESAEESRYRVDGLDRPVHVVFRPRADGGSVAVALASMACKYFREVCMAQFNRFWRAHLPQLAPTAGYPVDAKRFYAEIQPVMARLGLAPDQVWRKR